MAPRADDEEDAFAESRELLQQVVGVVAVAVVAHVVVAVYGGDAWR